MKRNLMLSLVGACVLLASSVSWAASVSGYSSDIVGPNVFSKNWIDTKKFNAVGTIPAGSKISNVQYSYSTSYRPSGFEAHLCPDSTLTGCLNITSFQSGSTKFFNGRTPSNGLVLVHRVLGSGTLSPPVYGKSDQIIVMYEY